STFQSANPRRDAIGHEFQEFVTTLERAQSEYDLGSENIIKDHGSVRNAQFTVGARTYRTVVVPPGMENIDRPTFDLLLLYAQQGGRVLLFEEIRYIDGAPAEADIRHLLKQGTVEVFDELTDQLIRDHFLPEDIIVAGDAIVKPYLYHHTRLLDDGRLLFVANSSLEDDQAVTVTATGKQVL